MSNNELQEILGARFKEHTHPTNDAVWSAIEARLDEDQSNRKGIWFWIFNGLAATVLFGCMIHTTGSKEQFETEQVLTSSKIVLNQEEATADIERTTSRQQESASSSENAQGDSPSASKMNTPGTNEFGENQIERAREKDVKFTSYNSNKTLKRTTNTEHNLGNNHLPDTQLDNGSTTRIETIDRSDNPKERDITIGPLAHLTLAKSMCPERAICTQDFSNFSPNDRSIELPIHLGLEFSYLKRTGTFVNTSAAGSAQDTSNFATTDQLADNRHFEISAFGQFDFTKRFSTSFGLGYSRSLSSFESLVSNSTFASVPVTKKSELQLITVPIQTKFNIFTKNRFSLNGGLTFQGEFGRITFSEEQSADISTTISTTSPTEESAIVGKINIQQVGLEPYVQLSVQLTPRISTFTNAGYRMYVWQTDIPGAPQNRLNYLNVDAGLLFRLR
jgi:hypothetical protein